MPSHVRGEGEEQGGEQGTLENAVLCTQDKRIFRDTFALSIDSVYLLA